MYFVFSTKDYEFSVFHHHQQQQQQQQQQHCVR
jgi:hypothetical protein